MVEPERLKLLLERAFPGAVVQIEDLTGTRDHYRVEITAEAFRGHSRMRQHKLVYEALGSLVGGPIHALSLKTGTPQL